MRITHTFGPEITKGPDLRLVDRQEQIGLLKQRDASPNVQKKKLTPGSQQTGSDLNFLVLSEIAFDKKHQFAVVKYLFRCGERCGGGSTLVMENVKGGGSVLRCPMCDAHRILVHPRHMPDNRNRPCGIYDNF